MTGLEGSVVWGVVPYAPQTPFRIYAGTGREPFKVDDPKALIQAAKKGGDSEVTLLVPGKARPVLVISESSQTGEVLALRLARFSKLGPSEKQRVRDQRDAALFHLKPESFPGLAEENAAMIGALVRVDATALDAQPLGRLNDAELTTVHERFVKYHGFDLRGLVMQKLVEMKKQQDAARQGG